VSVFLDNSATLGKPLLVLIALIRNCIPLCSHLPSRKLVKNYQPKKKEEDDYE
jgi:hypothetical protein